MDFGKIKRPDHLKLDQFDIHQFRNYLRLSYKAHPGLNLIVGHNGAGKTNFLDAIYYSALGRSYFTGLDKEVIRNGSDYMRLDYQFDCLDEKRRVVYKWSKPTGKKLEVNRRPVEKMSEFLGAIRVVMMAPQDAFVLLVGNTERRKWVDQLLCQLDVRYAQALKSYQSILSRRNAYLKGTAPHVIDDQLLDAYWDQMEPHAMYLYDKRKDLLSNFHVVVDTYHARISDRREAVQIKYKSILDEHSWDQMKKAYRKAEIFSRSTQVGVHKDKIAFQINGKNLKYYGSQGQIKSFFIALKMAEFDRLTLNGECPILLVDDVFAKLDGERISRLFALFRELKDVQIFVTDTNLDRLNSLMTSLKMEGKLLRVESSDVSELEEE